jgi:hypothetical protein
MYFKYFSLIGILAPTDTKSLDEGQSSLETLNRSGGEMRRGEMRRNWIKLAILAAVGCLIVGVAGAGAEEAPPAGEQGAPALLNEACNSGHACVWSFWHFQEAKGESLCTGGVHNLSGLKRSAKNRCANKAVWIRDNGVAHGCINPGLNMTTVEFHEIWVGAEGSRC